MDSSETVESLRERESELRKERLRLEALRDNAGLLPECERCGVEFVGRSDARFCSTRCRVAAHRAANKLSDAERKAKKDAELQADAMRWLDEFYEMTKDVAWNVEYLKMNERGRKKVIGWLRDAIEDIEAL